MMDERITIPDLMLVGVTRVALGVGVGFLLSERLDRDQRKAVGWALFGVGVATTIPLVLKLKAKTSFNSMRIRNAA